MMVTELKNYWFIGNDVFHKKEAVFNVYYSLWTDGGCISQCEFGAGAKAENVHVVFEAWNEVI